MKRSFQEKDFTLSEIGVSLSRMGAVSYSIPYIIDVVTYAYPAPHRIDSYNAFLWPFSALSWVTVIASLFANSIIIRLFTVSVESSDRELKLGVYCFEIKSRRILVLKITDHQFPSIIVIKVAKNLQEFVFQGPTTSQGFWLLLALLAQQSSYLLTSF